MNYSFGFLLLMCFLISGTVFFSVNIIALRIFSRIKLLEAFKKIRKENLADRLIENAERLVLACSLYRLIFNIGILLLLVIAFSVTHQGHLQISDYLIISVIALVIFSLFSLAIPNVWAKYTGEKILSLTYSLLMVFAAIASPILYIFQSHDGLVRQLAGVVETTPEKQQEDFLTGLEQRGVVDEEEQEMIENVLELSDTTVSEVATPRTDIVAIEVRSDLQTVLETINAAGYSRVPVYEENIDNIVGFIYAKDMLTEIGKTAAEFRLKDKLRPAYFVPETKPLRVLLHEFQNQKLHIAIVLDEYGGTAGIITIEDILEELVGEIADEYEETPPEQIKRIDKNAIELDARTHVDDLNSRFELNLPEDEDYDTIGGFVFSHLGYIPKTGKSFDYENLKFTIASAEARKIKRIRIQKTIND